MENQQEEQVYFPKLKTKIDPIIIVSVIGIVIIMVLTMISIRSVDKKPVNPKDEFIQQVIDTAAKANLDLQAKQATLDSIAHSLDEKLNLLDEKVSKVKNKETIIREYYHERISQPGKYTPQQVDSFFKDRYNY